MDLNLSFEIQNGLNITETGVSVFSGTAAPNVEVYDGTAAAGTLYLQTNGDAYLKTSSDWVKILTGSVSISLSTTSAGLTIGGSPTGQNGALTINLAGDLAAVEALSLTGLAARTGTNTWATREVLGTAGQISVSNGTGVSGNPQISLSSVGITPGTYGGALTVPMFTVDTYGRVTAVFETPISQSLSGLTDVFIPGSTPGQVLTYDGTRWINSTPAAGVTDHGALTGLADDDHTQYVHTTTARTVSAVHTFNPGTAGAPFVLGSNATGQLVTGLNADTLDGNHASAFQPIDADLTAIAALATTGIAARTGTDTWAARTITGTSGRVTVTNGNGVSGNPTIDLATAGTAGTYGSSTQVPVITTDAYGRVTSVVNTTLSAPPMTLGGLTDVTLTSPTNGQVLSYNGTNWVNVNTANGNASGLVGAGQAGAAAWALDTGSYFNADFVHNLATTNVVITVFDTSNNQVVVPNRVTIVNANTVRLRVFGNTKTLRVVVVANGKSIAAGGSTPSSVIVAKDSVDVVSAATRLNFTGQAVTVTNPGGGVATVSIGSRFTFFAASLDTPNSADWAVNANAPLLSDPSFASINERSFSNTVEQGVGFLVSIPPGATTMTFKTRGRAQTAPGAASVVQFRVYFRALPNNSVVGSWVGPAELPNLSIPTNANFQYYQQSASMSTLGLNPDTTYLIEVTRRVTGVTGGTNLASPFLLAELTVEFS